MGTVWLRENLGAAPDASKLASWFPDMMTREDLLNLAVTATGTPPSRTRNNLIAFVCFATCRILRDDFSDPVHWNEWRLSVARATMSTLGLSDASQATFIHSRLNGFESSLEADVAGRKPGMAEYFLACCSTDQVEVNYSDVEPDLLADEDMTHLLTDSGRRMLERQRAMPGPRFPMSHAKTTRTSQFLASIWKAIKDNKSGLLREWA